MIVACTKCGSAYEAESLSQANAEGRKCFSCRRRGSLYQELILRELERIGRSYMDPRHIEAYMRLEWPVLDHLPQLRFAKEVHLASACVQAEGEKKAEELARSYGL